MLSALYVIARPSVCLSIRWVNHRETVEVRIMKFSSYGSVGSHIPLANPYCCSVGPISLVLLKVIIQLSSQQSSALFNVTIISPCSLHAHVREFAQIAKFQLYFSCRAYSWAYWGFVKM